ncbi:MAG: 3-hydroxybutyryl-CoA dehydrogenase [Armatimonadetes bacterium]|nr:3-hydroxybutyryl-CoA dehydrogenase [Armatimonadota bacterium]
MKTIAVIGAGTMGSGIAQTAAQLGFSVIMRDVDHKFVDKGLKGIKDSLARFQKKGALTEADMNQALGRIMCTTDLSAIKEADLVVEAVTEDMSLKKELFRELDQLCPPKTVFASNTSSLSIAEMSLVTGRPEKFVGMHFFNPVPMMKLVEIVRTPRTSDETFHTAFEVARKLGKTPIGAKDTPGFIFNRLIVPYLNEAMWALHEGVGTVADIDAAMKLGGNMPIGPLALLDLIGIDVQLLVCETFHREFGDPKFRPCPLNRQMVRAGYLGKKCGKGFYDYTTDPPTPRTF